MKIIPFESYNFYKNIIIIVCCHLFVIILQKKIKNRFQISLIIISPQNITNGKNA